MGKAGISGQFSWLEGTITYAKEALGKTVDIHPFQYYLVEGPAGKKASNGGGSANGKDLTKSKYDEHKENLRDFLCNAIPKLDTANAEDVYKTIVQDHPDYLPVHMSMIHNLEGGNGDIKNQLPFTFKSEVAKEKDLESKKAILSRIVDLSDLIIKKTPVDTLLAYYGLKSDTRPDAAKIKANMDKQKALLIEAWTKKVIALGKLKLLITDGDEEAAEASGGDEKWDTEEIGAAINSIYVDVGKLLDVNDQKVALITLWHAFTNSHLGRMAKVLHKMYEEKMQRDILEESRFLFKDLDWPNVVTVISRMIVNANPQSYRPF